MLAAECTASQGVGTLSMGRLFADRKVAPGRFVAGAPPFAAVVLLGEFRNARQDRNDTMLNKLDDYPIHQTSDPIAVPASSDRNVYDRNWYNGYASDGSYYFGLGVTFYPHRHVLDCHFSVMEQGGHQHCFYGSRRAPLERTDMAVGPLRYEILEPMRSARLTLDDNESGISCDLVFEALTASLQEPKLVFWSGARRVRDSTRFTQFGRWRGTIRHPDGEIVVDETVCRATKDRSWGIRMLGEPEGGAPPASGRSGMFFVWAPLFWDDHVTHALIYDDSDGNPIQRAGMTAPLYANPADILGVEDGRDQHTADVRARVRYRPNTRRAAAAELDMVDRAGRIRTIQCRPVLDFHMKGLGYGHPKWGQGLWHGEMVTGHESFDPALLDPMARENMHVQQIVQINDGERSGVGVFEHICTGANIPPGSSMMND
jgi:hypothetical protein